MYVYVCVYIYIYTNNSSLEMSDQELGGLVSPQRGTLSRKDSLVRFADDLEATK